MLQSTPARPVNIIALVGPKQVGKTTVASAIQTEFGYTRMRFADTLKAMLGVMGLDREHIDGNKKELPLDVLGGKSARFAMVTLGTEWRDMIDKSLWANLLVRKVQDMAQNSEYETRCMNIVIDDMRFPHELAALDAAFPGRVTVWRINKRDTRHPVFRMWLARSPWGAWVLRIVGSKVHPSEAWWPCFRKDVSILNESDLTTLYRAVKTAMQGQVIEKLKHARRIRVAAE